MTVESNPSEVDSGDEPSSSDDSGSNTRPKTSSAGTPTCGTSPGISSSDEGKKKNTMTGGGGAERSITIPLNLEKQRDSNWLDVEHCVGVEDVAAEDEYHKIKNMENNSGSHNTKDGQAKYDSQVIDHDGNGAEDEPRDKNVVEHGEEDTIVDLEMDGIEVYGDGSYSKDDHRAGVEGDAEGWWYFRATFVSELML